MKTLRGLVDAQEMSHSNPDTFEAPNEDELSAIRPGDHTKVCKGGERFWVFVTSVTPKRVIGRVANQLIFNDLKVGETIALERRHVYSIHTLEEAWAK